MLGLLLADSELREGVRERARARIGQNYSWDLVTREVEQVYLEMMKPSSSTVAIPGAA